MSIINTVLRLEKVGLLIPYRSSVARAPRPQGGRRLWLTSDTFQLCCPPGDHPDRRVTDASLIHLGEQMNAFVLGEFMDYKDGIDIKRLCPDERDIWEIKSYFVKPQLRLLGFFAVPKWFIGTNFALRDDLEPVRGPKWNAAISFAEDKRAELVGHVDYYNDDRGEYVRNPT
jgi:hypothetical protein